MIGFFSHPHSTSIRKQLTKTPKFYFFDNGVVRAIQGLVNSEPSNQDRGYLFEQLMIQEAVRINRYHEKDLKLTFWRTASGAEVDLIFSRGGKILLAIEFKVSPYPSARDFSGLKSFNEEYPKVPKFLCAPVEHAREVDGMLVIPPKEFFEKIKSL